MCSPFLSTIFIFHYNLCVAVDKQAIWFSFRIYVFILFLLRFFAHGFQKMMLMLTKCPRFKGTVKCLQVLYSQSVFKKTGLKIQAIVIWMPPSFTATLTAMNVKSYSYIFVPNDVAYATHTHTMQTIAWQLPNGKLPKKGYILLMCKSCT